MLGAKLKELRERKGMAQRHVAAALNVDTAYISKMERNEKPISRTNIKKLSEILDYPEEDLQTIWLAEKLYDLVKTEPNGIKSLDLVMDILKMKEKN